MIHSWDVARAVDGDEAFDPADNLIANLRRQATVLIPPQNCGRAFGALEVEVGVGVPTLSQLIAFSGRRPAADAP